MAGRDDQKDSIQALRTPPRRGGSAIRVVVTYAIVATVWIFSSDLISRSVTVDPNLLTEVAVLKGVVFVVVTASLLYGLIRANFNRLEDAVERLSASEEQVRRALQSTVEALGRVTEARDPYTAGHQRRVSRLAVAIAEEMGLSRADIEDIRIAGSIHDIGKISVPAEILTKPGVLSPVEFDLVRSHAQSGHDMLSEAQMPERIVELVYEHHERCDGSGYPRGLKGARILDGAKILMVADVVEAISSHRPYRAARGLDVALDEIAQGAGSRYDKRVCSAALRLFRSGGFVLDAS